MDGGIRTGADVVKALCMGARTVFIGRPALWGLAYNVSRLISPTRLDQASLLAYDFEIFENTGKSQ